MLCWETGNVPVRSGKSMMSGGVCCAETGRQYIDHCSDHRSRMDVWDRTEELSAETSVYPICSGPDQGGDGIYGCASCGGVPGDRAQGEKTVFHMADPDGGRDR